jgi:hypothetical protein
MPLNCTRRGVAPTFVWRLVLVEFRRTGLEVPASWSDSTTVAPTGRTRVTPASWHVRRLHADASGLLVPGLHGLTFDATSLDTVWIALGFTPDPSHTDIRVSHDGGASWEFVGRQDIGWVHDVVRKTNGCVIAAEPPPGPSSASPQS